jgi:hypothetical protein
MKDFRRNLGNTGAERSQGIPNNVTTFAKTYLYMRAQNFDHCMELSATLKEIKIKRQIYDRILIP